MRSLSLAPLLIGATDEDTAPGIALDCDSNGRPESSDLAVILSAWGATNPPAGDLDRDGTVGGTDLTILLGRWGPVP